VDVEKVKTFTDQSTYKGGKKEANQLIIINMAVALAAVFALSIAGFSIGIIVLAALLVCYLLTYYFILSLNMKISGHDNSIRPGSNYEGKRLVSWKEF